MRVVLDTNVLVSAAIKKAAKSDYILRQAPERYELLTSDFILSEVADVLPRKHIQKKYSSMRDAGVRRRFTSTIRNVATVVEVRSHLRVVDDSKDDAILACAVDGKADYLVTNDTHLLKLGAYEDVQIVTPDQFLEILKKA